jgi:D,D-heptose 1,7-bisphosphate phosphatase
VHRENLKPWAVFLDRDGTINELAGLVSSPDQLRLLPGVPAALRNIKAAGALLVLITNQPVVAREMVTEDQLEDIHVHLQKMLQAEGAELDAIYYCPHHPETNHPEACNPKYRRECDCRKPKPGLIVTAARDLGIDLGASFFVGDSSRDIAAGAAAGCTTILVRTGCAGADNVCPDAHPDLVVDDLSEAAVHIKQNRIVT